MARNKWEEILKEIAREHHTTVESVRREMALAMEAGQRCPDPAAQALWREIAGGASSVTPEALLDYLLKQSGEGRS